MLTDPASDGRPSTVKKKTFTLWKKDEKKRKEKGRKRNKNNSNSKISLQECIFSRFYHEIIIFLYSKFYFKHEENHDNCNHTMKKNRINCDFSAD